MATDRVFVFARSYRFRSVIPRLAVCLMALLPAAAAASQTDGTQGSDRAAVPVQRPTTLAVPQPEAEPTTELATEPATVNHAPTRSPAPQSAAAAQPARTPAPAAAVGPQPKPVAAPAAPRPTVSNRSGDPAEASGSTEIALSEEASSKQEPIPHAGTVLDFRVGTMGCIGGFCRRTGHNVRPGARLAGFLGRNVRGWFEIGLGGGWGTMRPDVTPGTNALLLYGLDPNLLQQALLAQAAGLINVNLGGLAVSDAELRSVQAGPSVRVHFIPRGRVDAFVGSGVGYNRLRARYQTAIGDTTLDFHGVEVPVEANVSVYVHRNIAVGVQFDYMWTWYGLAVLDHPQQRLPIPVQVLDTVGSAQGADVQGDLPQFWTLGLALRGRL